MPDVTTSNTTKMIAALGAAQAACQELQTAQESQNPVDSVAAKQAIVQSRLGDLSVLVNSLGGSAQSVAQALGAERPSGIRAVIARNVASGYSSEYTRLGMSADAGPELSPERRKELLAAAGY